MPTSQKRRKRRKKKILVKFYDVVSEQVLCFERVGCMLPSFRIMGRGREGEGGFICSGTCPRKGCTSPGATGMHQILGSYAELFSASK